VPPRYSYWTILAGGLPTAFRAADREELLPTFQRLREKHPDAELKWFARGRLWNSPDEARRAGDRQTRTGQDGRERRDRDWRPGGSHRDPRQPFIDAKKARNAKGRQDRFDRRQRATEPWSEEKRSRPLHERPEPRAREGGHGKRPDWREPPREERQERFDRRPRGTEPRSDEKRSRPPHDRPAPRAQEGGYGKRPDWRERPREKRQDWRRPEGKPSDKGAHQSTSPRRDRDERPQWSGSKNERPEWRNRDRNKPGAFRERPAQSRDAHPSSSRTFKSGDGREQPRNDRKPWGERPEGERKPWRQKPPDHRPTRESFERRPEPRRDERSKKAPFTGERQNRRTFDRSGFERNQANQPPPPPRPRGPDREPRPSEDPGPTSPPRPDEPRIKPPGPPERGRRDRFPKR
jgi:hypothetical protein